jgi:hypothetical protein
MKGVVFVGTLFTSVTAASSVLLPRQSKSSAFCETNMANGPRQANGANARQMDAVMERGTRPSASNSASTAPPTFAVATFVTVW